ncbi:energy transducer TonB [Noviherbaspirillum humi]|nr:hypothetical protein [Noviherbaspirillum humi]
MQHKVMQVVLVPGADSGCGVHCLKAAVAPAKARKSLLAGPNARNTTPANSQDRAEVLNLVHYYNRRELSQPPHPMTEPHIAVPTDDKVYLVGSAHLRIYLSEFGQVDEVAVLNATLPENYVEGVVTAYRQMAFHPGELNGENVKSQIDVVIDFSTDLSPIKLPQRGT